MAMPKWVKGNRVYNKIWNRTRNYDKSFFGVGIGSPGSGKSVSAGGRFLYDLDRQENGEPRFTVDRVVFKPKNFLKLLKKNMPKGSGVLWDEVGVTVKRREWYSLKNRIISSVFQTMRFKNRILMLTVPALSYIDKNVGPLVDGLVQMAEDNTFANSVAHSTFYWLQYNAKYDKFYYKRPRGYSDGVPAIWSGFDFHKPPEDWVKEYTEKQDAAKQEIIENAEDIIGYMREFVSKKGDKSNLSEAEIYEMVKRNIDDYLNADGELVKSARVMVKNEGLDYRRVARACQAINEEIKLGEVVL